MVSVVCLIFCSGLVQTGDEVPPLPALAPAEHRAQRLETFLVHLSSTSGISLRATPGLGETVVVVRHADIDLAALMERVATVAGASWRRDGDGFLLERPPPLRQELERHSAAQTVALLSKALNELPLSKDLDFSPYDRARAAVKDIQGYSVRVAAGESPEPGFSVFRTPAKWFVEDLLALFDAQDFAALPYERMTVFSSDPHPHQLPLPEGLEDAMRRYDQTRSFLELLGKDLEIAHPLSRWALQDAFSGATFTATESSKALLFATRGASTWWLQSSVYDGAGRLTGLGVATLTLAPESLMMPLHEPESRRVPLRLVALEKANHLPMGRRVPLVEAPDFRAKLVRLLDHEPLSASASDAVFGLSKAPNLIANVPDQAYLAAREAEVEGEVDVRQFLQKLQGTINVLEDDGDWFVLAPCDHLQVEQERVPRRSLERFLSRSLAEGEIGLQTLAMFHYEAGAHVFANPVVSSYRRYLGNLGVRGPAIRSNMSQFALAFLGGLDQVRWGRLMRGEPLDLGYLRGRHLDAFLDWSNASAQAAAKEPPPLAPDVLRNGSEALLGRHANGVLLSTRRDAQVVLLPVSSQFWSIGSPMTPEVLVDAAANLVRAKLVTDPLEALEGTWQVGTQPILRFRAHLRPGIVLEATWNEHATHSAPPVRAEDLPRDVIELVKKAGISR
jgi:hypothetical protein